MLPGEVVFECACGAERCRFRDGRCNGRSKSKKTRENAKDKPPDGRVAKTGSSREKSENKKSRSLEI
jgi:hypothetical protein